MIVKKYKKIPKMMLDRIQLKRKKNVGCNPTQLTKLCLHQMQTQKTKKKYGK